VIPPFDIRYSAVGLFNFVKFHARNRTDEVVLIHLQVFFQFGYLRFDDVFFGPAQIFFIQTLS
jgi:hypothetical protein